MKKISDDVLERFISGDTTAEESMAVLQALHEDSELMERYIAVKRFEAMMAEDEEPSLPMEKMAAKAGDNLCDIICERYILKQRLPKDYTLLGEAKDEQAFLNGVKNFNEQAWGEIQPERQISTREKKWLTEQGVALYNVGRILEGYGFSVTRQFEVTIDALKQLLKRGESLIVVVNEGALSCSDVEELEPDHAVCLLNIEGEKVVLFNPRDDVGFEEEYSLRSFETAWSASKNYVAAIGDKGSKVYEPHPINLDEIELNPEIEDLIEPIAENLHDIWAQSRMNEGYSYGPENNSDPNNGPLTNKDLRPYSELPDSEKEYDRKMAVGTLKLAARLGFKIIKTNPEDGYVCPDCRKRIELEMSFCPHCGRELELGDFVK